jgi:CRISPR system Cascade subunit CasA
MACGVLQVLQEEEGRMTFQFNLADEPWIPCVLEAEEGGAAPVVDLSLRETLTRAHELAAIAGDSPPVTAALHRLLLAIVHRCTGENGETGPVNAAAWEALWRQGRFDVAAIDSYLDEWGPRFDLFDPARPLYQTVSPAVSEDRAVSMAKMLFQSDNNPTLFDHTFVADPPYLSAAHAARLLVAYQAFDTGGLITGTGPEKFAKASPLLQCAVLLVRGHHLFETLMLNLFHYSPENGLPWDFERDRDRPAWEREGEVRPEDRRPDGYLDLLTWQSRRIRLWPEEGPDGQVTVRRVTIMKGFQIPDGWPRHERETMVAFRKRLKPAAGQDPNPPLGFQADRALWRDSLALFESMGNEGSRPKNFDWLASLAMRGIIRRRQQLTVDALGLMTDPAPGKAARLFFWRHERLTLPLPYLQDDGTQDDGTGSRLRARLRQALDIAENVGRLMGSRCVEARIGEKMVNVPSPFRLLAQELLGIGGALNEFVRHLDPGRIYWAQLEEPFRRLLERLPEDVIEEDGRPVYGETEMPTWREAVRAAALAAFDAATRGMEQSGRTLRAVSLAERDLRRRLYEQLGVPPGTAELINVGGDRA